MNIKNSQKIHIIGIGGIGASALAQILKEKGKEITGSDQKGSKIIDELRKKQIDVKINHSENNIEKDIDIIIYSPAIPEGNVELKKAKEEGITTLSYPEALGEFSKDYEVIAIAGTHGKSTTTAMTALILENGGVKPTVVIGTKIKEFGNKNFKVGNSKYLIIEACEYKESFLNFTPAILVITNIEADHLDYYKNEENYRTAFKKIIAKTTKTIIINENDQISKELTTKLKTEVLSQKNLKTKAKPSVPGKFNIENAELASLVGEKLEIPTKIIKNTIENFKGTWRRMEIKKTKFKKKIFIDDYAHHPTEIKKTLRAIKEHYTNQKILCIFQPHQYNRTHELLNEFAKSFKDADKVIIPNIYKVRDTEEDIKKVSPEKLIKEINKNSQNAEYGDGIKNTTKKIEKQINDYDVIVTMGAGNINSIYETL